MGANDAITFDDVFGDGTNATIPAVLDRAAQRFGDLEAFVDGDVRLTFAELRGEVDRTAKALIAAGIRPGDRVCVWGPNDVHWLLAALGTYRVGGVVVPLNTRFKGPEAAYVLRTAGVRLLFTVIGFLDTDYPALLTGTNAVDSLERIVVMSGGGPADGDSTWDDFINAGAGVDDAEVATRVQAIRAEDLSDIMFTSGTTGKPKGAMLRHGSSVLAYDAWATVVGLRAGDRYLVISPFFHAFGLKAGIVASLIKGATIIPQLVFDVPQVMRRIAAEKITMLPGAPAIYQTLLDHPDFGSFDPSSLRLAVTGAAPVSVELVRRMREELQFDTVVTGYGLTEATGIVTMCRHDDPVETIAHTAGRAIPGIEVRLVDAAGNDVATGEAGELWARGYNVMAGYFGNPEATAEAITADGWLRTGDIAVQDAEGNVRITDRLKDMYINGGFNVYPAEVENALATYPGVSQAAVIGVPDRRMGEVGMVFVVLKPGAEIVAEELIAWCRTNMANYKVPAFVEVVDALPMNPGGKVMKFELRQRFPG